MPGEGNRIGGMVQGGSGDSARDSELTRGVLGSGSSPGLVIRGLSPYALRSAYSPSVFAEELGINGPMVRPKRVWL